MRLKKIIIEPIILNLLYIELSNTLLNEKINNKKEPYYRIEKLPKEDKGEKGKKNLFQATIKKVTEFLQRAQTIKYKGYD